MLPLEGILVLEFCQFMAGPSAGLKLADLGARVIKIERPIHGEGGRQIAIKNLFVDNSSLVFHTVNRNKESYAANLKDPEDLENVKKLIAQADVMTHNFRPGVMEKIGLDYTTVKAINPALIYASVTGYGTEGPWVKKPGQDLLAQSVSGLTHLTGDRNDTPTAMGLAVADIYCGTHLTQGILAGLVRRNKTGKGALIEVSLLESMLDFQFEVITTYLNEPKALPERTKEGNAHAYLSAPYGVYPTSDGHIVLAMGSLIKLGEVLECEQLLQYQDPDLWFENRDEIMFILKHFFASHSSEHWIKKMEAEDIWCAEVLDYKNLLEHEGYKVLSFDQVVTLTNGEKVHTTRSPIQINDQKLFSKTAAPRVGEHTEQISKEFNLMK
ncbi:CaiB/BaiF CoA-transferase family protein [Flammeovirga sp. SJP92]|uniref:CaiB/BaiF CoA transferase family protein n=1 Tax=Flammeovirga sp. SJP92 TaxID=1775430 RepID=UPI000788B52F|nr:CoA transferase [Flammeovirga sp. SJP92]KXX70579.1 hypothetical protein AVL50_08225 [Flammeovirga sp. SJP92]